MLDHPHQKILVWICGKLSCLSACKKSTASLTSFLTCCREIANLNVAMCFILHIFIEILQRYCKLVVFSTLDMPGSANPKWYYHLVGIFCVYLQAKNQLHTHAFMDILQRHASLFWVLWACLVTFTQIDSINLSKTLIFICIQKINFIIHFFLKILQFKESCNLIGWQHFDR